MTVKALRRGSPPRPLRQDVEDVAGNIGEPFDLEYVGLLPPEEVLRRWPGPHRSIIRLGIKRRVATSKQLAEMTRFRGAEWARMVRGWRGRIPPVIVGSYEYGGRTVHDIFDGWGRTSYAMMTGHPLHVWIVRLKPRGGRGRGRSGAG